MTDLQNEEWLDWLRSAWGVANGPAMGAGEGQPTWVLVKKHITATDAWFDTSSVLGEPYTNEDLARHIARLHNVWLRNKINSDDEEMNDDTTTTAGDRPPQP